MPALGKPDQLQCFLGDVVKTTVHAGRIPAHGNAQGMKSFEVGKSRTAHRAGEWQNQCHIPSCHQNCFRRGIFMGESAMDFPA
jgi:hypothetical protein